MVMAMSEMLVTCLRESLEELLGQPVPGTVAYVRCLPGETRLKLPVDPDFRIPGWEVYAVTQEPAPELRWITADQAVDLREAKQQSILLLVDPGEAGTGMDGIYSAGREIGEKALLDAAGRHARRRLEPEMRTFAERAISRARRLVRAHTLSPYRTFEFYAACAQDPDRAGEFVTLLGLWPIAPNGRLREEDLDLSVQLVERLLLTTGAANPPQARVKALLLPDDAKEQTQQLEEVLRQGEGRRWTETVRTILDQPTLWVNRLQPGFVRPELREIRLVSWYGARGNLLAWSGLVKKEGEDRPYFLIQPVAAEERAGRRASGQKLEIHWRTEPAALPAGTVEYDVSVVTGSENVLASRTIAHSGQDVQRCAFTAEDFEDLGDEGKWEVQIRVRPLGETQSEALSEEFILTFGEATDEAPRSSVGRKVRALVEEAIRLSSSDDFGEATRAEVSTDKEGFISCRLGERTSSRLRERSVRVVRPRLVQLAEENWQENGYPIGRWVVAVQPNGTPTGSLQFEPLSLDGVPPELGRRLEETCRTAGQRALQRGGFIGVIYHECDWAGNYVNAWAAALDAAPLLALAHTVEVRKQSGAPLGLVVLPSHPLLVAWHQAYDELAYHMRYVEKLKPSQIIEELQALDASYFPSFLPGTRTGESYVFGDTLGFYTVAMIRSDDPEPQSTIAQLASCLSGPRDEIAPSVSSRTADAIGREIARYIELHPEYSQLRVHALRPGDGRTVIRALGSAVGHDGGEENSDAARHQVGIFLELYPSPGSQDRRILGRFLSETAERRRAGVGALPEDDRWMFESYDAGGLLLPLLRWARRAADIPTTPSHLSIAFDTFDSQVQAARGGQFSDSRPLECFGMAPSHIRDFRFTPVPTWVTTVAPNVEGDRHPAGRVFTDRLLRLQSAVMRATARTVCDGEDPWPVLVTQIAAEKEDALRRLHELSDWVITVDRNAGIEYFDAPRDAPDVYERYVIDCVPERQDLHTVQLVTSTSHIEEVSRLLDHTLVDMGLSCSPKNCEFLLTHLKALSGRLAMRLASRSANRGELIALALFHANCAESNPDSVWLSLRDGFLVPLDDVQELLFGRADERTESGDASSEEELTPTDGLRSDLVYVSLTRRGVQFSFVEVKYRRLLRSARDAGLLARIQEQTACTRRRWFNAYFSPDLSPSVLAIRRKRLARALRFYLEKARRHHLGRTDNPQAGDANSLQMAYQRLRDAIDRLCRPSNDAVAERVADRGYIFCPDYQGQPAEIATDGATRVVLCGPQSMPDQPLRMAGDTRNPLPVTASVEPHEALPSSTRVDPTAAAPVDQFTEIAPSQPRSSNSATDLEPPSDPAVATVRLGRLLGTDLPATWEASIRSNPHLMVVGLPGMGKTTCLVNLCHQLFRQGIVPLVFSYHEDLDARLEERVGQVSYVDIEQGLGFNPMRVTQSTPNAWIDNVGMLRDIFASIFPDLGDLQTNEIREAIKASYVEQGYRDASDPSQLSPPDFQRFFDILRQKTRPNAGLMARLTELDDYGFFRNVGARASLLESTEPVVIRLHTTQNDVIQNAMASFILLNLYQNMFIRRPQPRLTHVVVFDEAHRASRLKLIPTMAKECRKFGLSLVVASQQARDFGRSLYSAIANYLILRVTEADATALARNVAAASDVQRIAGRLKQLNRYTALFVCEGRGPRFLSLAERSDN